MKNHMILQTLRLSLLIIWIAPLFTSCIFADDGNNPTSNMQFKWVPKIQEGYISLEVKNKNDIPISFAPYLNMIYPLTDKDDPAALLSLVEPKVISVAVVVVGAHPGNLLPIERRGPMARPIEVGPGETKTIKFLADENLLLIAKGAASIQLCMFLDNKAVNITPMTISKGIWSPK